MLNSSNILTASRDQYSKEYFEHGLESGKSNYFCYRWLCEGTLSMIMTLIDFLDIKRDHTILDLGCAKGFLVKAFRLLHRQAWGLDISAYAIENVDLMVKEYCYLDYQILKDRKFDFCISKDTFEHIPQGRLQEILYQLKAKTLFVIIPLGENGEYRAPSNNLDVTHIICKNEIWWQEFFLDNGWEQIGFTHKIDGVKDSYYEKYPLSHGFFTLRRSK